MAAMATALLELTIYRGMLWTDYLIVLATNLCRMLTIETTMMFANLVTTKLEAKQILTAGVFSMATRTDVSDDECDGVDTEDELCTV